MLVCSLDTFGRHLHPETAAETDYGMEDRRRVGGVLDRTHEGRIELELVERETPQIEPITTAFDGLEKFGVSAGWHKAGAVCRYGPRAAPPTSARANR